MSRQTLLRPVALLIALVVAMMTAALAPFRFTAENQIGWLEDRPGIRIDAQSLAHSEGELDFPGRSHAASRGDAVDRSADPHRPDREAESGSRTISIEMWVEPDSAPSGRVTRIVAIRDAEELPVLSADQWRSNLILRDRFRGQDGKLRYREHAVHDVLQRGVARHLVITSDPSGTRAYVDGAAAALRDKPALIGEGETFGGRLLIGNASRGNQSWAGELHGLAFYDRSLEPGEVAGHFERARAAGPAAVASELGLVAFYAFDEAAGQRAGGRIAGAPDLLMPAEFRPLRRTVLHWPGSGETRRGAFRQDLLLNILGFVPFGFLLARIQRGRGEALLGPVVLRVLLAATALSLSIELTQSLIPSRVSSTSDLIANAAGGGLGALLEAFWSSRRPAERRA